MYNERHYSVSEVAEIWNISPDLARDIFRDESGVVSIVRPTIRRRKRGYTTLRIPESVLKRVHGTLSNNAYKMFPAQNNVRDPGLDRSLKPGATG